MVGSIPCLRLPMRWAMALLSSRWPTRSGAIAGDAGLPQALPLMRGEDPALESHTPVRAFSGVRRRLTRSKTLAGCQAVPYHSLAPPEQGLEGMGSQAGGDPDPRRSYAPSVRLPPSRIGIPIRRHRCREAGRYGTSSP